MRRWVCGNLNFLYGTTQMQAKEHFPIKRMHASLPNPKQKQSKLQQNLSKLFVNDKLPTDKSNSSTRGSDSKSTLKKDSESGGQLPPIGSRILRVPSEKTPLNRQASYGIIRTTRAYELRRTKQNEPVQLPPVKLSSPYLPKEIKISKKEKIQLPVVSQLKRSNTFVVCKGRKDEETKISAIETSETPIISDSTTKSHSSSFIPVSRSLKRQQTIAPRTSKLCGTVTTDSNKEDTDKKTNVVNTPAVNLTRKARMRF